MGQAAEPGGAGLGQGAGVQRSLLLAQRPGPLPRHRRRLRRGQSHQGRGLEGSGVADDGRGRIRDGAGGAGPRHRHRARHQGRGDGQRPQCLSHRPVQARARALRRALEPQHPRQAVGHPGSRLGRQAARRPPDRVLRAGHRRLCHVLAAVLGTAQIREGRHHRGQRAHRQPVPAQLPRHADRRPQCAAGRIGIPAATAPRSAWATCCRCCRSRSRTCRTGVAISSPSRLWR